MLRAMFFAIGTFVVLTGCGLFFVDSVVLTRRAPPSGDDSVPSAAVIDPPDWLPHTLSSCGALTMLYALALPRRD